MRAGRLKRVGRDAVAAFGLCLGCAHAALGTTISSDFSVDTDGWTQSGATTFQQQASGGNPGGFLYIDNGEGAVTYLFAPAKYLGDLRAFDGGVISFDGIQLANTGTPWQTTADYGHLTLSGPGGTVTMDLVPGQPGASWTTYQGSLTPAAFAYGGTQAQWSNLLSNVTIMRLSVEAVFGGEIEGIDNFRLVPEPALSLLLGLGGLSLLSRRRRV
jgi:hypothetical protein